VSRILVTGSSGRLGRTVVTTLRALDHEVFCTDRSIPSSEMGGYAADLTDAQAAHDVIAQVRPEAVVHLAAIAVPFSAPEQQILLTNAALAFNVAQASVELGVGKVVVASSPTVFGYGCPTGWMPDRLPLDENSPLKPWNAYALSKTLAEQVTRMFVAQVGDAVRFATFRPCYVIAPEEWEGAVTQQGHTVAVRLDNPQLAAPSLFNYVDARDVGAFLDRLLDALATIPNGETFMVGAADALAREPLAQLIPRFIPEAAAAAAELTGTRPAFSIAKAQRLLGWHPRHSWRTALTSEQPVASDRLHPHTSGVQA
jgi:UDP-glucose 4-epimerase